LFALDITVSLLLVDELWFVIVALSPMRLLIENLLHLLELIGGRNDAAVVVVVVDEENGDFVFVVETKGGNCLLFAFCSIVVVVVSSDRTF